PASPSGRPFIVSRQETRTGTVGAEDAHTHNWRRTLLPVTEYADEPALNGLAPPRSDGRAGGDRKLATGCVLQPLASRGVELELHYDSAPAFDPFRLDLRERLADLLRERFEQEP